MLNKKSIYGHLSNEADLVQMKSLKPVNKYNRLNFSFKCSECGKISSRNLRTIVFPFKCRNCVSKQTHTTDEYYAKYNKSMVEKYGENYREILDEHRNQVVKERYGSYSGMFIAASDKRNATMKARYGVTHPAKLMDMVENALKLSCNGMVTRHIIIVPKRWRVLLPNSDQLMRGINKM